MNVSKTVTKTDGPLQVGAEGHTPFALGAEHVTVVEPVRSKPGLHVNVATLPWASPSEYTTVPLAGAKAREAHVVAATQQDEHTC